MVIRTLLLVALVFSLILAGACGGGEGEPTSTPGPSLRDAPNLKSPAGEGGSRATDAVDRLIVQTVNVNMLVKDVAGALESVASLARGMGGFVLSSQLSGEEESRYGYISIRVPVEQADAALAQLRALAVRVESENSSAQDVTEEYVDLQARLKNFQNTEEQYLVLLKRTETVEDALKVQRELSNVQGQIEQLKGQMQYLERTSATLLIAVELRPASTPSRLVQPGWSAWETAKDALRGLVSFGQGLADLAIRVGLFAPVWLSLAAVGWLAVRWWMRRARRG